MATTKYLDYAGLQHIIEKLYARGFNGMGLSHEDFTAELKAKYDALAAASSVEDLTALFNRVTALEKLVEADSDQVINKFNEIVSFLAGIEQGSGLKQMLADIATQIADAKKAGTDAAAALAGKVDKVEGKGLSTNDYTTAEKNAVATIGDKVDKEAGKGLSSNDYTAAEKAQVAKIATMETTLSGKLDSADVAPITNAEIDALVNPA